MDKFAIARMNMVTSQIQTNKVTNKDLISIFYSIPRELFVPKSMQSIAYVDKALEIGDGRYMLEPMLLARLLQASLPKSNDVVLDIACGTGYSTAIISKLVSCVIGVDDMQDMVDAGNFNLQTMTIENARIINSPLSLGYNEQAPYDIIVIGGGVQTVSQSLLDKLSNKGRLVTVEYTLPSGPGLAVLYEKIRSRIGRRVLFNASTPLLSEFCTKTRFVF
ncbi:protein-L-isoaspartate family protein [Candidatus Endolissoclinum faulkneri L2]|uniref:Protein-L-isoaspartate O-methyltransferase n=1 Tax=Candidatus Endolissoclinum faulkneri L2 TaxID=1193729 RepID=K7YS31_9PROT|nr:protein-L-isoaspartate O-methyltransferase [Candidatus Endolissoclinum faulkneri]AFX99349.1 protein-L-isoaspartate family protein [Candidatus Endolissoclinum faulkneri L2]